MFHQNPGNLLLLIFRTDFLAKNCPRLPTSTEVGSHRDPTGIPQESRMNPIRGGIEPGPWGCEQSSRPLGQICPSSQTTPKDHQILKIEMSMKPSKRGPQNLILSASCTELKGEQLWFSSKESNFWTLTVSLTDFSKNVSKMSNDIRKSGPKLTKFLWNGLIIHPRGAKFGCGAFGKVPGP